MQCSNPINAHYEVSHALMPAGTSRSTNVARSKTLMKTMENTGTNDDTNSSDEFISKLLATTHNNCNENFFTYIKKQGCCAKKTPNTPVHFWDAMSEAASLRVTLQRIVRKFLNYHLGDKVIMIDKSEKVKKDKHVKHAKHEFDSQDGRRVVLWHRSLPESLQLCIGDLGNEDLEDVKSIEICLGGDHGKGSCTFVALTMKICISNLKPLTA